MPRLPLWTSSYSSSGAESSDLCPGQSLVWFGKPDLLFALYGPAVTAGLLLPHAIFQRQQPGLQSSILGHGLLSSLIAALLTQLTARSGFMFAAWGFCSFLAAGITEEQVRTLY